MYQLYDDQLTFSGGGYGLMGDNKVNFRRKPVANALHNLTSLLAGGDRGVTVTNPNLTYGGDTSNLKVMVLQKTAGEHWIALWRNKPVFDIAARRDIAVPPTNLTVNWSSPRTATFYSGLRDAPTPTMEAKGTVSSVTIPVGAEVVLLKLRS